RSSGRCSGLPESGLTVLQRLGENGSRHQRCKLGCGSKGYLRSDRFAFGRKSGRTLNVAEWQEQI
ncbi:unnamed protein product, partial [Symbiodinium necroappetens]